MFVCMYMCVRVYVYMCMCVYVYTCVRVYVYMCVCVSVCVLVRTPTWTSLNDLYVHLKPQYHTGLRGAATH